MAVPVTLNGITYSIPITGEVGWGSLTNYLVALSSGVLTLSGGNFPLTGDINFGPNYGVKSPYFASGLGIPATAGVLRLTNTESVMWRNGANTSNLALSVVGDQLYFAGVPVGGGGSSSPLTTKGDLYTYTTTNARLGVGTNGKVLVADSSQASGLAWQTVSGVLVGFTDGGPGINTALGVGAATNLLIYGSPYTGTNNTAIGYNSANLMTYAANNTAVGAYSMAAASVSQNNVAIGYNSAKSITGGNCNTAVGAYSLEACTTGGDNVAIGYRSGHAAVLSNTNISIGSYSLEACTITGANVAIGYNSTKNLTTGYANTAIGGYSLEACIAGVGNIAIGWRTAESFTGSYSTLVGTNAGLNLLANNNNTALGAFSLSSTGIINCTALGYNAQVTGNNQVQLGEASTTTYAYGAVQNRSDIRDKADITDTTLGLSFINALRPVDFRWDMREDYRTAVPAKDSFATTEEYDTARLLWLADNKLANITHDGTHKRGRKHHGLIAQEVKTVIDSMGTDFGGLQDHNIAGGDDVLSIGYEELIAPMIKAIQELKAEIELLKANQQIN